MPFARVGAMPQPTQNKQRSNHRQGNFSGRQKGITMEDLKKQTAIRLAQEQKQSHASIPTNSELSNQKYRPVSDRQKTGYQNQQNVDNFADYQHQNSQMRSGAGMMVPSHVPNKQKNHQSYHPAATGGNSYNVTSFENYGGMKNQQRQYFENNRSSTNNPRGPIHHDTSLSAGSFGANNRNVQDYSSPYQRTTAAAAGAPSPKQQVASKHESAGSGTKKQKLPHGLTVHELKEMTKARLQAEAAERHDADAYEVGFDARRGVSPLDFDTTEVRERAMSRDSANRNNQHPLRHGSASDSITSIPSLVHVNQACHEQQKNSQQVHPQSFPPGFQAYNNPLSGSTTVAENGPNRMNVAGVATGSDVRQYQPKTESWESGSVTSHNSTVLSEGIGSETGFQYNFNGSSSNHTDFDAAGIPFTRSRSYPTGQGVPVEVSSQEGRSTPSSASASPHTGGSMFFDAAPGGPNRRRASTLSPKPGLIHEDRPHICGDSLKIPNFTSSNRSLMLARSRNNYSPVIGQIGIDNSMQNPGVMLLGQNFNRQRTSSTASLPVGEGFNRPRTHSATSLPPISRTADEFAMDRSNSFSRFNPGPLRSRHDSLPEDLSMAEGINQFSYLQGGFESGLPAAASNEVFREFTGNSGLSPPGFVEPPSMNNMEQPSNYGHPTAFSRVASVGPDVEPRKATSWQYENHNQHAPGSDSLFSTNPVEDLSRNMGSILKLSGIGDRPDRERSNTYPNTSKAFTEDFGGSFRF